MLRKLKVVVLSDVHLGTFGCHSDSLLNYLQSIKPEILVLNGDFIDGWQFRKSFFPIKHIQVIYEIMKMAMEGTKVYYLAGNHDEFLRKFVPFYSGNIFFREQLELEMDGKRYLIFHGDAFDFSIRLSPFTARIGGLGYDTLIRLNTTLNAIRSRFGWRRISFAHAVKTRLKKAIRYIHDFEREAIRYGQSRQADVVICGHIHIPVIKAHTEDGASMTYMNSGDWVENLTALEYSGNRWMLYRYDEVDFQYLNRKLMFQEKPVRRFREMV